MISLLAAALAAGALSALPASADHGNDLIRIRDTYWDISLYNVSSAGQSAVTHARTQGIDPILELETRLTADLSIDDFAVSDAAFGENYYGRYTCINIRADGLCEEGRIRLDTAEINASQNPSWQWKKSVIHEFGHAAGLGHRFTANSTMMQGDASMNNIVMFFDTHDVNSIRANY